MHFPFLSGVRVNAHAGRGIKRMIHETKTAVPRVQAAHYRRNAIKN